MEIFQTEFKPGDDVDLIDLLNPCLQSENFLLLSQNIANVCAVEHKDDSVVEQGADAQGPDLR